MVGEVPQNERVKNWNLSDGQVVLMRLSSGSWEAWVEGSLGRQAKSLMHKGPEVIGGTSRERIGLSKESHRVGGFSQADGRHRGVCVIGTEEESWPTSVSKQFLGKGGRLWCPGREGWLS